MKHFHAVRNRLYGIYLYIIWYSGENEDDGVAVDVNGYVPAFRDRTMLHDYARNNELDLNGLYMYNLGSVEKWLQKPRPATIDCVEFLKAWNLFTDIDNSVKAFNYDQDQTKTNKVYSKLFWGNNLPPVTPKGRSYEPIWSQEEAHLIQETLVSGFELYRKYVRISDTKY